MASDAIANTRAACAPQNSRRDSGRYSKTRLLVFFAVKRSVYEEPAHSLKYLVEFLGRHFPN